MLSIVSTTRDKANFRLRDADTIPNSPSLVAQLERGLRRNFAAKEHVFVTGDLVTNVYRVEEGTICLYKIATGGKRQIVRFCFGGDIFGFGAGNEHAVSAQVLYGARVRYMAASVLTNLAALHPRLGTEICRALADELASLQDHLFIVGQRTAIERVANFLVFLSRRNAAQGENPLVLALHMTRLDIGDYLGLTLETVSRTLTKLRVKKLVDFHQGSQVALLDLQKLEELADVR
jgi:CRP/FNR family transcriptional regulator, anaerobic regulatory protein